jgi:hypothetical protein
MGAGRGRQAAPGFLPLHPRQPQLALRSSKSEERASRAAIQAPPAKPCAKTGPIDMTLKGLDNTATYDLVVYAGWVFGGNYQVTVTQDEGTGLGGSFVINLESTGVGALTQDTDARNNASAPGNYIRLTGLTPDVSGFLGIDVSSVNGPFNGFQLIETGSDPSSFALTIAKNGSNPGNYDFEWVSQDGKLYDLVSDTGLATAPGTWPVWNGNADIYSRALAIVR